MPCNACKQKRTIVAKTKNTKKVAPVQLAAASNRNGTTGPVPISQQAGNVLEEMEVPIASDVVFRKVWNIERYGDLADTKQNIDSPTFRCAVNGMLTQWNMAIRFWTGDNGKKVSNPIVVCLNLCGCETEDMGQVRVRFQFGVWDWTIRQWECCSIASTALDMVPTNQLTSIGYKNLNILDRHLNKDKDIDVMVKMQIIRSDEEVHSLSQDMGRLLADANRDEDDDYEDDAHDVVVVENDIHHQLRKNDKGHVAAAGAAAAADTLVQCSNSSTALAHSWVLRMRSPTLARHLVAYNNDNYQLPAAVLYQLDLGEVQSTIATEFLRYLYTDKVDNTESNAAKLLPLAARYRLPGLRRLCERALLVGVTPANVASILLVTDRYGSDSLRKALMQYCERTESIRDCLQRGTQKTLAWRVMEMVNPDLFTEACQSLNGTSPHSDSPSSSSSTSSSSSSSSSSTRGRFLKGSSGDDSALGSWID